MSGPTRLKDIPLQDYSDAQKAIIDKIAAARGRLPLPVRVWLQSPKLAQVIEPLSTMLNTASVLAKREWEIAVIVIARHWKSPDVIDAHCKFLLAAGAPEAIVEALRTGHEPPLETDRERAVYDIAMCCHKGEHVSDASFKNAERLLGADGMEELIAFIGYYSGVALAMKIYSPSP